MSQRIKSHEIVRHLTVASRTSAPPALRVQADLDSSRGYDSIGGVAASVFARLGETANRAAGDAAVKRGEGEEVRGQAARTQEKLTGTEAQASDAMQDQSESYRRGYFLTEGANRLHATKLNIAKEVAKLRTGEDMNPIIQQHMSELLTAPEFQDPAVLRQMQPAIQQMQQGIAEYRQKTELAEIFDSQRENLSQMVRDGFKDGSLMSPESIQQFRQATNTEQFGYLDQNETDDLISENMIDMIERGEIDPSAAQEFLQMPLPGDTSSMWDRAGWGEKFETAVAAGGAVRQRAYEEEQANFLSGIENQLQNKAQRGALSEGEIGGMADRVGLTGKDRLSFVRRWRDQNDAGLKHMQSEARRAKEHKQVMGALTANNVLSHTNSQLSKAAEKEWDKAVTSGDFAARSEAIARFTRAGVVIPQLKDLLSRTTRDNLTANYRLYAELAKLDPIVADRYVSDANAALFAQHHDNQTRFGMTAAESLSALPTGANKATRSEVASDTSRAASTFFKDSPTFPDGTARTPTVRAQIIAEAVRLGVANPDAEHSVNLSVAERRVLGNTIVVNGNRVPKGGARANMVPAIDRFVRDSAASLTTEGVIPSEMRDGVYAAPMKGTADRFVLMLPTGYPAYNPKSGRPISFDPAQLAIVSEEYDNDAAEARARAAQARKATQPKVLMVPDRASQYQSLPPSPERAAPAATFPTFLDYLQTHRTKPKGT